MKKKLVNLVLIFFILIVLEVLFFLFFNYKVIRYPIKFDSELLNPLRKQVKFKELHNFKYKIKNYIDTEIEKGEVEFVSFYFRSLNDGLWFGINEKELFAPASLLKVPLMLSVFKFAETNPDYLNKKIKTPVSLEITRQYYKPLKRLERDKFYSVEELVERMILYSDNEAFVLLTNDLNRGVLKKVFLNLGLFTETFQEKGDFVSIKTYSSIFRILYNASYLNEKFSEKALSYLDGVDFKEGIVAGIPKNIKIAHKFGESVFNNKSGVELHDVGIIYDSVNPYILGVMTKGKNFDQLANIIKEISNLVYEEVKNQYNRPDSIDFKIEEE